MSLLKITAIEPIDVEITERRMITQVIHGMPAQRPANNPPRWIRLQAEESREVVMAFRVKDRSSQILPISIDPHNLPEEPIHGLLRIERV